MPEVGENPAGGPLGSASAAGLRGLAWFAALVVGVVVLVAVLSAALRPHATTPPVMTDGLGPSSGDAVPDYLAAAAATLDSPVGDPAAPRFALATFDAARSVAEAAAAVDAAGIGRIAQAEIYAPVARVAMPVLPAAVAAPGPGDDGNAGPLGRAVATLLDNETYSLEHPGGGIASAGTSDATSAGVLGDARRRAQVAYTAGEAAAGRPVLVGLVVRADVPALRALAASPGIRAVEAVPPDAVWGRIAVRPLLPEQAATVAPLPDDGDVPVPAGP